MTIRFTSSLTADDENLIAPAVIQALSGILNLMPIAYSIRIDTSDAQVYQLSGGGSVRPSARSEEPAAVRLASMEIA